AKGCWPDRGSLLVRCARQGREALDFLLKFQEWLSATSQPQSADPGSGQSAFGQLPASPFARGQSDRAEEAPTDYSQSSASASESVAAGRPLVHLQPIVGIARFPSKFGVEPLQTLSQHVAAYAVAVKLLGHSFNVLCDSIQHPEYTRPNDAVNEKLSALPRRYDLC